LIPFLNVSEKKIECKLTPSNDFATEDFFYIQKSMAKVKLTSALKRFFPTLSEMNVNASNIRDVLIALEQKYPGISGYLVDDDGRLRQHVNIFVKGELIKDRDTLTDSLNDQDEVLIFQALSGG
jgi:molybdopterin converting factor small subunit